MRGRVPLKVEGEIFPAYPLKAYSGSRVTAPFLTSALDKVKPSTSRLGRFTPDKEPLYPLIRRLDGLQSVLRQSGEEKTLLPLLGLEPVA